MDWREYVPTADDIYKDAAGNVYITATSFKVMDGFEDVREVKFPSKWNNGSEVVNVTNIDNDAFSLCSTLQRIELPDTIVHIGNAAFKGCTGLSSISLGNSLSSIGHTAFIACTSLEEV